ncbi:ATP-dependent protease La (LON) domain protein [Artemisia annua]|uniref:ATP-dependent protease La (LON) domain protein n=1 Tax=Artemisia annua TaxID=35608 RepID=A0A2U1LAW5_ARTAN|nr:ATP-dependent protease La (LON) domain protein [Artemisia annua]
MSCCINKPFTPTSIAVTPSSVLISNITHNSLRTRRTRGSVAYPGFKTHAVNWVCNNGVGLSKKKRYGFVVFAGFLELPLLPFPPDQVLVPSETKTLHLFEARYLKLLDECLFKKKKLFVHFVLDPIVVSSTSSEASFAARYGCLVVIDKVEQLDVGALVTIRGIGRVTLVKFAKSEPFLEGVVLPLQDNVPQNESEISSKVLELKEALHGLNSLEIKLKAGKDAPLQTQTANSLEWALKEPSLDCEESFIPSFAERVSFSALQNMSGSTQSEMLKLQEEKLKAMDMKETEERLEFSLSFVKNRVSMTAAKLAIQSLNMK